MCLHLIKSATSLRFHKYRTGKVSACCGAVLSYDNGLSSSATLVSFWTVVGPTPVAFRSECSSTWSVLTGCSVVIRQQEPTSGIGLGAAWLAGENDGDPILVYSGHASSSLRAWRASGYRHRFQ